jgi:hypothetical protein
VRIERQVGDAHARVRPLACPWASPTCASNTLGGVGEVLPTAELPILSTLPTLSTLSTLSNLSNLSTLSTLSNLSNLSTLSTLPTLSNLSTLPTLSNLSTRLGMAVGLAVGQEPLGRWAF